MDKKRERKKVGSYKVKEKNIINLNKFYKEKIKEWQQTQ
jgi:hypothetical protein